MAPRPNWKGFHKLSLVSFAVALYPATTSSQRIRFNIINRKTGNRINEVLDTETGEPVEPEDRVNGYQFEKGQCILVEEDELDNAALDSTHTIDIEDADGRCRSHLPRRVVPSRAELTRDPGR